MIYQRMKTFGSITQAEKMKASDLNLSELAKELSQDKLLVIRGLAPLSSEEFLSLCSRFEGVSPMSWSFGPVMEMKESQDPENYLFSRERVPFHWDGAFYKVPDYLVFCCIEAPTENAGGETLFTSTTKILADASPAQLDVWQRMILTFETEKRAHYGGKIQGPLVQKHPHTKQNILRFAEAVETELNPVSLQISGVSNDEASSALTELTQKIYDPLYCYSHKWQVGDLIFADNHSLIHGRTAFELNCPRHLRRIQLIANLKE